MKRDIVIVKCIAWARMSKRTSDGGKEGRVNIRRCIDKEIILIEDYAAMRSFTRTDVIKVDVIISLHKMKIC